MATTEQHAKAMIQRYYFAEKARAVKAMNRKRSPWRPSEVAMHMAEVGRACDDVAAQLGIEWAGVKPDKEVKPVALIDPSRFVFGEGEHVNWPNVGDRHKESDCHDTACPMHNFRKRHGFPSRVMMKKVWMADL